MTTSLWKISTLGADVMTRTFGLTTLLLGLFGLSPAALSHPGPLDENGGHYNGASYHCHLSVCEEPDTFTRGNRDSFFFDPQSRDKFFNAADWPYDEDFDGDCQNTRNEILVVTSRASVSYTNPRNCEARIGEWFDEYTGKTFTVAAQLELDHIIPLRYAHNLGGDAWPQGKKVAFANDPLNLILTERSEARRKNERGPSRYLPREEYRCDYVRQWLAIAEKYELRLATTDSNRITVILRDCGEE
ncbi:MAG: hypothetical protein Q8L20_05055 [Gammaproteobacteria bacterium]|nr:hypothetical protein [Gammaproteobacteria bacterium]